MFGLPSFTHFLLSNGREKVLWLFRTYKVSFNVKLPFCSMSGSALLLA
ncbi:hypothetical protein BVRB_2g041280 [Beta vulgaris subsp. vulgaris]|nr:hypothetical protein BVRB_2g041280 [Beta vulgaris subsp. vulgaris]